MKDFEMRLDIKVDSYIPFLGNLTPNDRIIITKRGDRLMIDYTLVGYEYLMCKRRQMSFLLDTSIFAINRSKNQYCDLLEQFDQEEMESLVVESLESETKKIHPVLNKISMKAAKTIFDNEVVDDLNGYASKKYNLIINYTSMTEKRIPQKLKKELNLQFSMSEPLGFLSTWQNYVRHEPKMEIKPKNRNKQIQLQLWQSEQFHFQFSPLMRIFQLFALCNPLAKVISDFMSQNWDTFKEFRGRFPVKIDVPINFSLFFTLEFVDLKFKDFHKQHLEIDPKIQKIPRKKFQNIVQNKEKILFAIRAFT